LTRSLELTSLLRQLWGHLSRCRQRQFGVLLGLMLVSVFSEALSLRATPSFLAVLTMTNRRFA
jgi:hypothetical protein